MVEVSVNGKQHACELVWGGESLLHVLREQCGLTGTKNACQQGECGSCTVRLDGVLVNSCLVLAAQAAGCSVQTVEGLAGADFADSSDSTAHPIQRAFVQAGAVQCGFCTPGMVMAAQDLLERHPQPSAAQVRHDLVGNLCRCTGYDKIVEAVLLAAEYLRSPA